MNYQALARQVQHRLDSGGYHWVSTDSQPEDYMSPDNCWPSADAVIQAMIDEGDLEAAE
jgi:hypothetical protein